MKTKNLEKLSSFQLTNEKLEKVLGGKSEPVKSFLSVDSSQPTGAGEICINGGCNSYSSDVLYQDGGYVYYNINAIDKPC